MGSRRGWNRTQLAGQRDRGVRTDSQPRAGGVLAGGRDRSCPGAAQPPRWVRAHQLSPCGQKTKETAPKPGWELALLPGAVQRGGCGAAVTSARPGASREAAQAVASLGPASPAVVGRRFICAAMLGQTRNGPTCAGQARAGRRAPRAGRPLPRVHRRALRPLPAPSKGLPGPGAVLGNGGGFRDSTALTEQSSVLCQQAKPQRGPVGPPRRQLRGPEAGAGAGGGGTPRTWGHAAAGRGSEGMQERQAQRRSSPCGIRAFWIQHRLVGATPGFSGDEGSVFRTPCQ